MDTESIKNGIVTNVYHIESSKKVALHKHDKHNEIFYCLAGEGFGVLEDVDVELKVGKVFNVPAGTMHALRTDNDLYVASFLIPVL
ncbi:MAG: cupin domain-containing protein [Solirubrobacterales bacterium]